MKRIYLLFFALIFISCNTPKKLAIQKIATFKKMEWLTGKWKIMSSTYIYEENWTKVSDTLYAGESIMRISLDTVLYDIMNIRAGENYIFLSSKSKISSNGKLNIYKLTKISKDKIIFENPGNTEQSSITYFQKGPLIMNILIEGKERSVESYDLRKLTK
ncbi:MAG: DUF6265 family protein [Bacteroidales bacterium]|jgi:hypothetical protein|nr:DUF6265 family protein [Bacteroidales bacterium]